MKKTKLFLAVFALVFVYTAIGLAAGAGSTQDETTVTCIVSGKEKSFLENPEKYVNAKPGELHSHEEGEAACSCSSEDEADSEKVKDPVCGMEIEKSKAAATAEYKGKTYYFCMTGCKDKFLKDPAKYIKDGDEKVTCPVMNREIARKDAAGRYEYNGKTFYFCCEDCKAKFIKNPEKYVK